MKNINNIVDLVIVEDNANDLELTLRVLKKNKLANNIEIAEDGAEALELLFCEGKYKERENFIRPKIIFLDLKLPKVSGLEVLKRLKGDPRTVDIPVVVLTSSKEENDIVESYKLGVNSYIVKPVDFDKFTKSIINIGYYWLVLNQVHDKK